MAKQSAQYYTGRMGNTIFYQLNGGYYIRSVPAMVKQAAATKIRSANFSIAVSAGRVLRSLLQPALPFPKDKKMQNSFAGAIMKWLKLQSLQDLQPATNLPYIQNFQFNEKTNLNERWKVALAVTKVSDSLLQLHIPAFIPTDKIAAPARTTSVNCVVVAASCTLQNAVSNGSSEYAFTIPYTNEEIPGQIINLPLDMPQGSLIIVAVSLTCNVAKANYYNSAFMPSGIIAAMYV